MDKKYRLTTISCFTAIFTQAVITNIAAILFIPLRDMYSLTYSQLGLLVAINFVTQVGADLIFSGIIDRIGYRRVIMPTTLMSAAGLVLFALSADIFPNNVFTGLALGTVVYSFACGLLEIQLSPIIDACNTGEGKKSSAISLLHSFYAWGQVVTIIVTTVSLAIFGVRSWKYITILWAVIPVINFFMFMSSKLPPNKSADVRTPVREVLFKPYFLLILLAIAAGASTEVTMNQWASAFMEKGLGLTKTAGDLIGMCGFAFMIGVGRMLYGIFAEKLNINKVLVTSSFAAFFCYIAAALSHSYALSAIGVILCGLATSCLWTGALMTASQKYPMAGAWMYAALAAAGDLGCSAGPAAAGRITDVAAGGVLAGRIQSVLGITGEQAALRVSMLISAAVPLAVAVIYMIIGAMKKRDKRVL